MLKLPAGSMDNFQSKPPYTDHSQGAGLLRHDELLDPIQSNQNFSPRSSSLPRNIGPDNNMSKTPHSNTLASTYSKRFDMVSSNNKLEKESISIVETDTNFSNTEDVPEPRRTLRQELHGWQNELWACLFFIAILFAMVGSLYPYDFQILPQWKFHISFNALLSFYAVLFKGALIFVVTSAMSQTQWSWFSQKRPLYDVERYNRASGNIWGSITWLWANKLRQPLTAFGAVIVICSLFVGPFIQQLVRYSDCMSMNFNEFETATLPRTNYFNPPTLHIGAGISIPTQVEQDVVISGLLSPPTDVNFGCSTGNCTFQGQYSTVGYCSSCTDISDQLRFTINGTSELINIKCNITSSLPSNLSVSALGDFIYRPNFLTMGPAGKNYEVIMAKACTSKPGSSGSLFGAGSVAVPECENAETRNTWYCQGYGAASCKLEPCVRTYKAFIYAGNLTEELISQSDPSLAFGVGTTKDLTNDWSFQGVANQLGMLDTQCISPSERTSLEVIGYTIDPAERWLPYNVTWRVDESNPVAGNASFPQSMLSHGCLYLISNIFKNAFSQYALGSVFQGTVSAQLGGNAATIMSYNGSYLLRPFFNQSHTDIKVVDKLFKNAADALTKHIRAHGADNYSSPARGTVLHYAICLEVDWVWISFPAVLAGLTITFLAMVIVATRGQQTPIWKSSVLPLVFHGPGGDQNASASAKTESLNSLTAMEAAAKRVAVKLDLSESSIFLRPVDDREKT